MSALIARTFLAHVHAAAGHADRAEEMGKAVLPELARRAKADTTDTRFPQELVEAKLTMGLAEMARARQAGSGAAAHWESARAWLEDARRDREALAARSGAWSFSREESESIERGLAECGGKLG